MNKCHSKYQFIGLRAAAVRFFQLTVLALAVILVIPASGADTRAVKVRTAPVYPEIAKRMRIVGEVKLSVTVDSEGNVVEVKKVSGNTMLSAAAEDAVRKWKFEPGPGTATVEVSLTFALGQ